MVLHFWLVDYQALIKLIFSAVMSYTLGVDTGTDQGIYIVKSWLNSIINLFLPHVCLNSMIVAVQEGPWLIVIIITVQLLYCT